MIPNEQDIPHGFIFVIIMFPSMLGNSLAFRLLLIQQSRWMATCRLYYLSLMHPSSCHNYFPFRAQLKKGGRNTTGGHLQILGFYVFETYVGILFSSIMKMQSQYITCIYCKLNPSYHNYFPLDRNS